jgi:hypothetical protein
MTQLSHTRGLVNNVFRRVVAFQFVVFQIFEVVILRIVFDAPRHPSWYARIVFDVPRRPRWYVAFLLPFSLLLTVLS